MSDTNINAFYMDVDDAKAKVELAKAELQATEQRLKDHPDYEAPKQQKPVKVVRSAKNKKFVSKDDGESNPDTTVSETVKRDSKGHFIKKSV